MLILLALTAVLYTLHRLKGAIMSELQDAVDVITGQLNKSKAEIVAAIADLEAREPSIDLTALKAAAQALDDVVPDAE